MYLQPFMARTPQDDPKTQALRRSGTLNLRPQDVHDELFREREFFDSRDLVQVKYEMLRRVSKEGHSISQAAASFGFSRPSFYQALTAFDTSGLAGLVPQKRGPKQGHKLTPQILGGCAQGTDRRCRGKVGGPDTDGAGTVWSDSSSADNRARIVAGSKKTALNLAAADYDSGVIGQYEDLRNHALTAAGLRQSLGYALFIGRGMAAWARACRSYASQPPTPTPTAPAARSSIPLDLRNQLALVLAGMILNLQTQEVCSC